jgi:flagellar basal-body rod modification protein FlgD
MTAATGVFSGIPESQALTGRAAGMADAGANGSGGAGAGSATISANDFLTLLVTEMQNQDPTTQTDPNEYINQLVAVNSLEQLIGINQTLTAALGTAAPAGDTSAPAPENAPGGHTAPRMASPARNSEQAEPAVHAPGRPMAASRLAPGNLSLPARNPAAERVAHALNGRARSGALAAVPAIR